MTGGGRRRSPSARRPVSAALVLLAAVLVLIAGCGRADESAGVDRIDPGSLTPGSVHTLHYASGRNADPLQNYGTLHLPRLPGWRTGQVPVGTVPVVMLIHGGGWLDTVSAETFEPLADDLAAAGVAVWNIEYRRVGSGGGWPTTFADVAAATDHLAEIGRLVPQLDIASVVVVGHSAGAQLAAFTASRERTPPDGPGPRPRIMPAVVVSLSGSLDMAATAKTTGNAIKVLDGDPRQVPDRYRAVSPIERLNPRIPFVLVHARNDRTIHYSVSERFASAFRRVGGRVTLLPLPSGGHGAPVSAAYGWRDVRAVVLAAALGGYPEAIAVPWYP